jgi:hypothetical protein
MAYSVVAWEIEGTMEFEEWYASLDAAEQEAINASIDLLIESGPALGLPHADTVNQSAYPNMKELRTQAKGSPLRTFFAFDPRRSAILLIGGDKTGGRSLLRAYGSTSRSTLCNLSR